MAAVVFDNADIAAGASAIFGWLLVPGVLTVAADDVDITAGAAAIFGCLPGLFDWLSMSLHLDLA